MESKEINSILLEINKQIRSEEYDDALVNIEMVFSETDDNFVLAEAYNQKGICLYNMGKYAEAVICFDKSFELDDFFFNKILFDETYNKANGTNFKKVFYLLNVKKFIKSNKKRNAIHNLNKFLSFNSNVNKEELCSSLNINSKYLIDDSIVKISKEDVINLRLAKECFSNKEYSNALKYLDKVPEKFTDFEMKGDLILHEIINDDIKYDDYFEFFRKISRLNEAIKGNDEALLVKGFYLIESGFYERALECYNDYLKKYNKDKRAIYGKMIAYNELDDFDYSLYYVDLFSEEYWKYFKSEILVVLNESKESIKILNKLLKRDKKDIRPILYKAMIYLIDLKFNKALKEYDKALKINPKNIDALLLKAEILFGLHRYDEAIDTFSKIPNKKLPKAYKKLIKYINTYMGENSGLYATFKKDFYWEYVYVELDVFKRIKANSIDDLKIKVERRGLIWKWTDRSLKLQTTYQNNSLKNELLYDFDVNHNQDNIPINEDIVEYYDKIIESDENNSVVFNNKGYVLLKLGRIVESIDCFDKALNINSNDYHAWFNKGFAYIKLDNYLEAKKCLLKSLELKNFSDSFKDELSYYMFERGWSLYESGKGDDSIDCYDVCINIEPMISNFYNCKAISLDYLEKYDEALKFYDKALEIEFDEVILNNKKSCYQNMIYYLFDNESFEECIICCEEYFKLDSNYNFCIWDIMGEASKFSEIYSNNVKIYNIKALSLQSIGRFDEALEFFDKALVLEPGCEILKKNKELCYQEKINHQ